MKQIIAGGEGFTLTEMLSVLAVVSIITASTVPGMASLAERSQVDLAVRDLGSALKLSRSEAIARNKTISMCARDGEQCADSGSWASGWLIFTDTNRNGVFEDGETLVFQGQALHESLLVNGEQPNTAVSWFADGSASDNVEISICKGEYKQGVALAHTGRVQRTEGADCG